MAKNRRRGRQRIELLSRRAQISSFSAYLHAGIDDPKGHQPLRQGDVTLELRGTLDEPVKGETAVRIGIHEAKDEQMGTKRPAVIGFVFSVKPDVHVYVQFPSALFQRTLAMAFAGHIKHAHIVMTPPKWGNADVPNISFSNEPIE
jgi:hypothetical protein